MVVKHDGSGGGVVEQVLGDDPGAGPSGQKKVEPPPEEKGVEPLSTTKLSLFQPPVKTEYSAEQRLAFLEAEVVRLAKENIAQSKEIAYLKRQKADWKAIYTQNQVDTLLFMPAETGPVDPDLVRVVSTSSQGGSPNAQADDILLATADSYFFGYKMISDQWIVFDLGRLSRVKEIVLISHPSDPKTQISSFSLETASEKDGPWTLMDTVEVERGPEHAFPGMAILTRYLRFTANTNHGDPDYMAVKQIIFV
jgi:hypothetical protein